MMGRRCGERKSRGKEDKEELDGGEREQMNGKVASSFIRLDKGGIHKGEDGRETERYAGRWRERSRAKKQDCNFVNERSNCLSTRQVYQFVPAATEKQSKTDI